MRVGHSFNVLLKFLPKLRMLVMNQGGTSMLGKNAHSLRKERLALDRTVLSHSKNANKLAKVSILKERH